MKRTIKTAAKRVAEQGIKPSVRVTKTFSLDQDIYAAIKRKCAEQDIPISALVDELLKAWLEAVGE